MQALFITRLGIIRYVALPVFTFLLVGAQIASAQNLEYFANFAGQVGVVLDVAVPVLVALALALFIWGMVVFVFNGGNDSKRAEGQKHMIWGLVALFVIVSVWGLVQLLQIIVGVEGDIGGIEAPELP